MSRRTPKNPYGLDLSFLTIVKQLDGYQDVARAVAAQMSVLDEPIRLINSIGSAQAVNVAEHAYRNAVFAMSPQFTAASRSIWADLADRNQAIVSAMMPVDALAGVQQSLLDSFAPYHDLAVEAARKFALAGLRVDMTQLNSLLVGALPAFLEELAPPTDRTTESAENRRLPDTAGGSVGGAVKAYATMVFWLAILLWVACITGVLIKGDIGEGHSQDSMRDSMGGIALLIVLADKVRTNRPRE